MVRGEVINIDYARMSPPWLLPLPQHAMANWDRNRPGLSGQSLRQVHGDP